MKKPLSVFCLLLAVLILIPSCCSLKTIYVHNPALNQRVMEDTVVDPSAVYGFRPDPASSRLGSFADADWTDPVQVEEWKEERIAYHEQFSSMYEKWKKMADEGCSMEEIAKAVSALRNQIRLDSYKDDPEGLERCKASNLQKYGNENGPTADSLFQKYGSWEKVLLKSFSENPGMDACLGLYDRYYYNYRRTGSLEEQAIQTYTVKEGDTLKSISLKYYGVDSRWLAIYNDNKDVIKDPEKLTAGQQLSIHIL